MRDGRGAHPVFQSGPHATFRVSLSWAANSLGVKFPSEECGPRLRQVVFTLDLTTSDGLFSARRFRIQSCDLVLATESPVSSVQTVFNLVGGAFGLARSAGNL